MAAAGLKSVEEQMKNKIKIINSTERSINLAFDMMNHVKNVQWGEFGEKIRIKIGIHYGRVIAGVIGFHKP